MGVDWSSELGEITFGAEATALVQFVVGVSGRRLKL